MALSGFVLLLARLVVATPAARDLALPRVLKYMPILTRALPPAANGDEIEAFVCIANYCEILKT